MRYIKHCELLLLIILIISGCEADNAETDIPGIPLISPLASAFPEQNAIRIEWEPNSEANLAGYRIYRNSMANSEDFQLIAEVSEKDNSYQDTDVAVGTKYQYKISAFSFSGHESDRSDAVSYTLLEKPVLVEPDDQAAMGNSTPIFIWLAVSGASAYTIHMQKHSDDGNFWEVVWESDKVYPYQSLRKIYNDDGRAVESLKNGAAYRWRVDSSGGRSSGSQSRWRYFSVGSTQ